MLKTRPLSSSKSADVISTVAHPGFGWCRELLGMGLWYGELGLILGWMVIHVVWAKFLYRDTAKPL